MKNILVDTGFWVAANNRKDAHHKPVIGWLEKNINANFRFVTTWIVLCESFFLIKYKVGFQTAANLIKAYNRSEFDVLNLELEHSHRVIELLNKYEDLDIDLADVSLVIAAEQYNTGEILTVDNNDFDSLRWKKNKQFKLILRDQT